MGVKKLNIVSNNDSARADARLPLHIAVIMDGNRRWAKNNGLPVAEGHRRGAVVARKFVDNCFSHGVKNVTLFAFSSDNWNREVKEVNTLLKLLDSYLIKDLNEITEQGVQIRIIGDLSRFNDKTRNRLLDVEEKSKNNTKHCLTLALSYSGRDDILHACKHIAENISKSNISLDQIDETMLSDSMMTCGLTDPDLLIRTSGESRLSNFMLWQLSYTELHFSDKLWPDFTTEDLEIALKEYKNRDRRYGA